MKIGMFTHSVWFGKEIYISPNGNIYCLYPFDGGIKTLIMDENMKFEDYKKIIEGNYEPDSVLDTVMVYWMYSEVDAEEEIHKTIRSIVGEYEEDSEEFLKKYNSKNRMETKSKKEVTEIKTVSPEEFFTKWKEMENYWVKNDGDDNENSYYNRIINQPINIELPLLGIKTRLYWCPPTVECMDELYCRMVDETYLELIVEKEQCVCAGGGFWSAEVPFEYGEQHLVMVVDNEHSDVWAVYQNVLKNNGKWDSVEYDELLVDSSDANNIFPDWQIYYIKALQLLAQRRG